MIDLISINDYWFLRNFYLITSSKLLKGEQNATFIRLQIIYQSCTGNMVDDYDRLVRFLDNANYFSYRKLLCP